jgi:hypothetical protein
VPSQFPSHPIQSQHDKESWTKSATLANVILASGTIVSRNRISGYFNGTLKVRSRFLNSIFFVLQIVRIYAIASCTQLSKPCVTPFATTHKGANTLCSQSIAALSVVECDRLSLLHVFKISRAGYPPRTTNNGTTSSGTTVDIERSKYKIISCPARMCPL